MENRVMDHWRYFNWQNIRQEAEARLEQQREVNRARGEVDLEKSSIEYWTAWCAHANLAACVAAENI